VRRKLLIAAAAVAFLAVSAVVARWLSTDNAERDAVVQLLRDQARGDAAAMLRRLDCRDPGCAALARANARRLRSPGEIEIARYDSGTAHALGSRTKPTRVVWTAPGRLTTVQCVLVRRTGNPLGGTSVTLLRVSAPIGRESGCG
jgi:hypothetical protein